MTSPVTAASWPTTALPTSLRTATSRLRGSVPASGWPPPLALGVSRVLGSGGGEDGWGAPVPVPPAALGSRVGSVLSVLMRSEPRSRVGQAERPGRPGPCRWWAADRREGSPPWRIDPGGPRNGVHHVAARCSEGQSERCPQTQCGTRAQRLGRPRTVRALTVEAAARQRGLGGAHDGGQVLAHDAAEATALDDRQHAGDHHELEDKDRQPGRCGRGVPHGGILQVLAVQPQDMVVVTECTHGHGRVTLLSQVRVGDRPGVGQDP